MILKTKIGGTFPDAQLCIGGYSTTYRLDRNPSGVGILLYVREDIPSKMIKADIGNLTRAYAKDGNYCVNLLRKTKKGYFADLVINLITDNKKFWQKVKPLFSEKFRHKEISNLVENETITQNNKLIDDTFKKYFCNIAKHLSLLKDP